MNETKKIYYEELLRNRCVDSLYLKIPKSDVDSAKVILDAELDIIKRNDWDEMFYILSELVQDSIDRKKIVFFRGMICSSLVAFLSGITDINPLEFSLSYKSLFGYKGNKEPSVEVNVPLGFEMDSMVTILKNNIDENRIIVHSTGSGYNSVSRLIILPDNFDEENSKDLRESIENIDDDMDISAMIYDYSQVFEGRVFVIKFIYNKSAELLTDLWKYTGINPIQADIYDKKVCSILNTSEVIDVCEEKMWNANAGTAGIPSFDSKVINCINKRVQATTIEDIASVFSLAHGTGCWIGTGEKWFDNGYSIADIISHRESIYKKLINYGIDDETAFEIMEFVRKGLASNKRKAEKWSEYVEILLRHNVPEDVAQACCKIKYLFPKAHSISYVVTELRIAWFKINYPIDFYRAWFITHKEQLELYKNDIFKACEGIEAINNWFFDHCDYDEDYYKKLDIMRVLQEMCLRNIDFKDICGDLCGGLHSKKCDF